MSDLNNNHITRLATLEQSTEDLKHYVGNIADTINKLAENQAESAKEIHGLIKDLSNDMYRAKQTSWPLISFIASGLIMCGAIGMLVISPIKEKQHRLEETQTEAINSYYNFRIGLEGKLSRLDLLTNNSMP
jgi:hypothetical protein